MANNLSNLDADQVIRSVYDESQNRLRVDAEVSASFSDLEVAIHESEDSIAVYGTDGSTNRQLKTDSNGELQVDILSSALPAGAATEVTLSNIDSNIDTTLSSRASEATLQSVESILTDIENNTDGIESSLSSINATQTDGSQKTQIVDGSGNVIGSTSNALDVNIKSGVTLEVNLDNSNDDVLVYGFDGSSNRAIKTDSSGELQIDVLSSALPSGAATEATLSSVDSRLSTANTTLSSISNSVDDVETKLDTLITQTDGIEASLSSIDSDIDVALSTRASESTLSTLNSKFTNGNDIGDVTINNASGGSAVNIQDGGNSITVDQSTASSLNAQVVGNIASAATDSGNPIKVGTIYNSTPPLFTNGQRADAQSDENGAHVNSVQEAAYTAMSKAYSATNTSALTVGTSETSIFLFKNPNGSGIKARIFRAAFTGAATYRVYHTPTITSDGTGLAEINQRIQSSPPTAAVTAFQSPTISANGTFIFPIAASTQSGTVVFNTTHQFTVNANFNILITAQAGANNTPVNVTLFWYEVP